MKMEPLFWLKELKLILYDTLKLHFSASLRSTACAELVSVKQSINSTGRSEK
jgi:hypothetical protein